ncbi:MAG: tyrosine--tRNA ligase [Candidatus Micrarchaeota archaeon]
MDIEKRIELVCKAPTEEIVTQEDLKEIFETYNCPRHYIGFEISGKVHIGSGLTSLFKIRDFLDAGIKPTILLADYHAWINGKLGGDLQKIQEIALGYFKHAFISLGLGENKVDYVLMSTICNAEYWKTVLNIGRSTSMNRILRTITIMGRKESEVANASASAIFYPAMQAADIVALDAQIVHAGMDQRKVHILAREIFPKLGIKKFAAVHCHMLPGLQGSKKMDYLSEEGKLDAKMSKSKPSSAIFIHDSEEEIKSKITRAFCPEKIIEGNPLIEYAKYICMRNEPLKVERTAKFGGDVEFANAGQLEAAYLDGKLHPADLKNAVANKLVSILKPSRDYFARHPEYLEQINATIANI